ncbi:MAG: lysylphosphatidylglycerol synthase transmembrane domain-containing protein [Nannocystaceae bacterium]
MSRFLRRTLVGVAVGVLVYVAGTVYVGADEIHGALSRYAWSATVAALVLSSCNYLLRFIKWEFCLAWLQVRAPGIGNAPGLSYGRSLSIYLAGLSMSVTPGKLGEVLRSILLQASHGIAFSRTAPIVLADRLTDLIALLLLSGAGLSVFAGFDSYLPYLLLTSVCVLLAVLVLRSQKLGTTALGVLARIPWVGSVFTRAQSMVFSSAALMTLPRLSALTALSVVGWGLECLGFWWILSGFADATIRVMAAAFLWSTTTLIGAVSFLPGGLGATEISLDVLLPSLSSGVTGPIAAAAILLARGCTLWFGELVGIVALGGLLRDPAMRDRASADGTEMTDGTAKTTASDHCGNHADGLRPR